MLRHRGKTLTGSNPVASAIKKVVRTLEKEKNKKINNVVIEAGAVILNGVLIDLVWNYEFTKKITSGREEAILKLEIIIDGDAVLKGF